MTLPLNPRMAATFAPPVMEARRWLDGVTFAPDRPLINVSQAHCAATFRKLATRPTIDTQNIEIPLDTLTVFSWQTAT